MLQPLAKKRILLGVTGGIAAYKSADLTRRLREAGAEVQDARRHCFRRPADLSGGIRPAGSG